MEKFMLKAQSKVFKNGSESSHDSNLFPLGGTRLSACADLNEDCKINEDLILQITGGDRNFKWRKAGMKETVNVLVVCKILILCNTLAQFNGKGMLNRIIAIPFKGKFVVETRLNNLQNDIFCMMMEEGFNFRKNGCEVKWCSEIIDTTNEVKDARNPFKDFVEETLVITDEKKDRVSRKDLFERFENWTINKNGRKHHTDITYLKPMGRATFNSKIEDDLNKTVYRKTHWEGFKYLVMNEIS